MMVVDLWLLLLVNVVLIWLFGALNPVILFFVLINSKELNLGNQFSLIHFILLLLNKNEQLNFFRLKKI